MHLYIQIIIVNYKFIHVIIYNIESYNNIIIILIISLVLYDINIHDDMHRSRLAKC